MKLATAVTLDGLVRALRWNVHDLAEAVEAGRAPVARQTMDEKPARRAPRPSREKADDRERR